MQMPRKLLAGRGQAEPAQLCSAPPCIDMLLADSLRPQYPLEQRLPAPERSRMQVATKSTCVDSR